MTPGIWRHSVRPLLVAAALGLTACSGAETSEGTIGYVEGYLGGVAADEPRAALVGRDVLSAGGTAADAATAVYFALSVTLPSSAGIGAGGVCLVHDRRAARTEVLEFLPQAAVPWPIPDRPVAVPAAPRGFFALQSRYGRLDWAQVVAPAEQLARLGNLVSRALAADVSRHGNRLSEDPVAANVFVASGGKPVGEGDFIVQHDLAATLANIRSQGPGVLYVGSLARRMAEAAEKVGGRLTMDDLARARPVWREPLKSEFGNMTVHFAPPPAINGGVAAQMWGMLTDGDRYDDTPAEARLHLLAEAGLHAFGARSGWLSRAHDAGDLLDEDTVATLARTYKVKRHTPPSELNPAPRALRQDPSGTSFVVVDPQGSAVACDLTLNAAFGTRHMLPQLGFYLAAAPAAPGLPGFSLGPMMAINENVQEFFFAAGSSGGVAAPTAMVNVAARVLIGAESLPTALAAKRVHHGGEPDVTFVEADLSPAEVQSLARRGHRVQPVKRIGRVNAISCPEGLPVNPESCRVGADPRRFGLGLSAD